MSASPMARQVTESKAIPIKRVSFGDPSELPSDYSSTPGGTLYSTTPGGTKIVYERSLLMNLRHSPISRTPPACDIPDFLQKGSKANAKPKPKARNNQNGIDRANHRNINGHHGVDDEQFQLDM